MRPGVSAQCSLSPWGSPVHRLLFPCTHFPEPVCLSLIFMPQFLSAVVPSCLSESLLFLPRSLHPCLFLPLCVFLYPHDQHKGLSEIIWLTNGPIINNIDPLISLTSSTLMTLNGYHYGLFFYSEEKILMNPLLTGRNLKKFKTTFLKLNLLWSEQA